MTLLQNIPYNYFFVGGGGGGGESENCVTFSDGDSSLNENITISPMKWFETPSVVSYEEGRFSTVKISVLEINR